MGAMTTNRLVLTNANVIDCVGERPIVGGSVVIERGQIAEVLDGSRPPDTRNADVIDLEGMHLHLPAIVRDLPAGGKRLVQRVDGYRHTLVAGVETYVDGEWTGAAPGRLVRGVA